MVTQNLGMKIDTMLSISVNTSKNNVPLSECYVLRRKICSLRKHPFLLALRRWGRFAFFFSVGPTVSDKNSWDTLTKRRFFPSCAPLVPLKVVYRGLVTKSCTPTLRGQGDPKVSQPF